MNSSELGEKTYRMGKKEVHVVEGVVLADNEFPTLNESVGSKVNDEIGSSMSAL